MVLRGYAREELSPQARERVWNEVQTLQVKSFDMILATGSEKEHASALS